jgi:multidrug efflux pump subunit AcrA (membrane-fusion protein)
MVPVVSLVRRAEQVAVYVMGTGDQPMLRQVRTGPLRGDQVEILSGLVSGDRVVLHPEVALRAR